MSAFSYAWLLRSRDKDGGHAIQFAIAKTPCYTNLHGSGVIADGRFTLRERGFSTFFAPVTLTSDRMTFTYANLNGIPWRYTGCANMKFLR